jgi:hypothetical protein
VPLLIELHVVLLLPAELLHGGLRLDVLRSKNPFKKKVAVELTRPSSARSQLSGSPDSLAQLNSFACTC